MQELLPNTDNFFKYLLTIGLLLIAFTIIYPIQRQKEIDIERINCETKSELLELRINKLKSDVLELETEMQKKQKEVDSLNGLAKLDSLHKDYYLAQRLLRKISFDSSKRILLFQTDSLEISSITLKYEKEKIKRLESYYSVLKKYKFFLIGLGVVFLFIGLRYWFSSVYMDELNKGKLINNEYRPSFVRHTDFIKSLCTYRNIIIALAALIILILLYLIF